MADIEEKEKHQKRLKRNFIAKALRTGENKGAFALKIHDPRKTLYKRKKISIKEINIESFEE